ncbi:MAG: alkaline phosphatase, partial [Acetobacteraceae bacterium]
MRRLLLLGFLLTLPFGALADPRIDGVAAGDPTATTAVLWVRAADDGKAATLRALVATDPTFATTVSETTVRTVAADDFTGKAMLDGLRPGTRYYYRFCAATCPADATGRFNTAPLPDQAVRVRFGFTGDADGRYRPHSQAADLARRDLDFLIFLGDTMYETRATGSPAVLQLYPRGSAAEAEKGLADYFRKYREVMQGVSATGDAAPGTQSGITAMLRATGSYTVFDNHEVGNRDLQAGGAPPLAKGFNTDIDFDANETGQFNNATVSFRAMEKAFYGYHPTRVTIAGTPTTGMTIQGPTVNRTDDPRMHGTPMNWFAQPWGSRMILIQTDARTYRDARLGAPGGGDDIGPRADNPQRTMLGRAQMAWLKDTLRTAQAAGTTWKFVTIASPIDQVGEGVPQPGSRWPRPGTQNQDGKSWDGGYRAERDELLSFIADNGIRHVVFLTTDDHFVRVTPLQYRTRAGGTAMAPLAFQIVSGPIGAGGPDFFPGHDCATILAALELRNTTLARMKQPLNGLPADYPGLTVTHRRCGEQGGPA